jgi:hypothetical protein
MFPSGRRHPGEEAMKQPVLLALIGGAALVAVSGALIATAETTGPVFIPGDKPVTEEVIREKLLSNGYADIRVVRQGRQFEAVGSKGGKSAKFVVDAATGRLVNDDDDDD